MSQKLTSILGELASRNGELKTHDDVLKELVRMSILLEAFG